MRGTDSALWHKWWNNGWSGWESLGGTLRSDPAAVSWGRKPRRRLCPRDRQRAVAQVVGRRLERLGAARWAPDVGAGGWRSWGAEAARRDCPGHRQRAVAQVVWRGLVRLGVVGRRLDSGRRCAPGAPGRMDVFARGTDNALWHKWLRRGVEWLGVLRRDDHFRSRGVSWSPERIDVFARSTDNALWHKWYDRGWTGWESVGGYAARVGTRFPGGRDRFDIFVHGAASRCGTSGLPDGRSLSMLVREMLTPNM